MNLDQNISPIKQKAGYGHSHNAELNAKYEKERKRRKEKRRKKREKRKERRGDRLDALIAAAKDDGMVGNAFDSPQKYNTAAHASENAPTPEQRSRTDQMSALMSWQHKIEDHETKLQRLQERRLMRKEDTRWLFHLIQHSIMLRSERDKVLIEYGKEVIIHRSNVEEEQTRAAREEGVISPFERRVKAARAASWQLKVERFQMGLHDWRWEEDAAEIKIARVYRGFLARQVFQILLQMHNVQKAAATVIQSYYRRFLAIQ